MIEDVYGTPEAGQLSRLIPAWRRRLVGKPIGSRVIIVAPPAGTYPQGNATRPSRPATPWSTPSTSRSHSSVTG